MVCALVDLRVSYTPQMFTNAVVLGADTTPDSRLSFAEITKMCWRLNVRMSEAELKRLFIVSHF